MDMPPDPVSAVTAECPRRIYSELAAYESLTWSDRHKMWIAAHPWVVREVLYDASCHVRPRHAPVPSSLNDSRAGEIFGMLVRMTEGNYHERTKRAIDLAFDTIDLGMARLAAARAATMVLGARPGSRFAHDVSAYTLGCLFGVAVNRLPELAAWAGDFARCLAPTASNDDIAAGARAAEQLWEMMSALPARREAGPMTLALKRAFSEAGSSEPDAMIANMIGFLFQAHDAVAGLIGNTVVHFTRHPETLDAPLGAVVAEVAHGDPPIQNTRRFVTRDTVIAGQRVLADDVILVVLAPGDERRSGSCPFGHGRHACPGQDIAMITAQAVVGELVRRGAIPVPLQDRVAYRPLVNARIPVVEYAPAREERE